MYSKLNEIQLFLDNIIILDKYTSTHNTQNIKKDQLFKHSVDIIFLETFFNDLFEIKLDEHINYNFSRLTIVNKDILSKINNYMDQLRSYYIICKQKKYLENLNEKKIITLLRQLLRTNEFELNTTEKYDSGKKYLLYTIQKKKIIHMKRINSIINFD